MCDSPSDTVFNIYFQFLSAIESKKYPAETLLEGHHICPKHAGGGNEKENIIFCSAEDHMLAHCYRFMVFQEKGDKLAYLLRKRQTTEARQIMQQLAIEAPKKKGNLFWNSEWQRKQGLKGGSRGGSANTPAQFLARQTVGLVQGPRVGRSRQSERLKTCLNRRIVWRHKDNISIETLPCDSWTAVVAQLNASLPDFIDPIRNETSFIKVLYGERKQIYGWRIESMAIRSEAEDGEDLDPYHFVIYGFSKVRYPRNVQRLVRELQQ